MAENNNNNMKNTLYLKINIYCNNNKLSGHSEHLHDV